MKTRFSTHMAYFWWLYALIAVGFALFWVYAMDEALQPTPTEQIKISTFSESIDVDALSAGLGEVMPQISPQNIRSVHVGSVLLELYNPAALNSLLYARAQECDFMIVEERLIPEEGFASAYFNICDPEKIADALGSVNLYTEEYEGRLYAYGIQLSGDGLKNNFTNYYAEDGRCWLMFCFKTDNMGGLIGSAENDAALQTIQWLLAEVE